MKKVHLPAYREYVKGVGKHEFQKLTTVNNYGFIRGDALIRGDVDYCFGKLAASWDQRGPQSDDFILLQVNDSVNDKDVLFTYYEWLFNYSLFRHCFVSKNINRILKDRMIILDPNQDSKLVINAMVAARMAWEEQYSTSTRIGIWYDMIEAGAHPSEALTLCHTTTKKNGDYTIQHPNNHELFDMYNEVAHLNFIESKLNLEGKSFNEVGGYKTIQSLFKANRENNLNLWSFVESRWGKVMKDNNPFSKPQFGVSSLTRDAFLGTIKEITADYSSKLKEMGVSVVQ